jgi:hypothetical protein
VIFTVKKLCSLGPFGDDRNVVFMFSVVLNWAAQLGSFKYVFVPFDNNEIEIGIENIRAVGKTIVRMREDSNAASAMSSFSLSITSFEGERGIRS